MDAVRIKRFLQALGAESQASARVYLTGGATAVLFGWRASTIDVDLKIVPESDELLRAIPRLKEQLEMNIELAAPDDFIPELPGWQDRSPIISREGEISFHHYDFYAQALAKIERGHEQDMKDVDEIFRRQLVAPAELMRLYEEIEPLLYRFPAVDPPTFRSAVKSVVERYLSA